MILGLYHVFTGSTGRYKVSLWYYRKLQEELRTQLVASPHTTGDILRLRWHLTQPERPMNYLKDSLLGRPRDVHGSVHTYRLFPGNLLNRGQQMDNEKNIPNSNDKIQMYICVIKTRALITMPVFELNSKDSGPKRLVSRGRIYVCCD